MMYKAIIFDMDGTLLNSNRLVLNIYQELTKKYPPQKKLSHISLEDIYALSYIDMLKKLYIEHHDFYLTEIYRIHSVLMEEHLMLFPKTIPFLSYLRKKGYRMGLVTSEMKEITMMELKRMKIDGFFDMIVTYDDVKKPKPHPEGLQKIIKYFKIPNHEVLWIGDRISDGIAGQKAKIQTGLLAWNKKSKSIESYFDFVFTSYDTIKDHLKRFESPMVLTMKKDKPFMIMQLTDLHLMDDEKDDKTYHLIHTMMNRNHPDFIVFTGDQTMSPHSKKLYTELGKYMDTYQKPYSYVFGNHDTEDGVSYQDLIKSIKSSSSLLYKKCPKSLGYSNMYIEVVNEEKELLWLIILMDTHIDQYYTIDKVKTWGYASVNDKQIDWYRNLISYYQIKHHKTIPSLLFMHIPFYEYKSVDHMNPSFTGEFNEPTSTPPISCGFFDLIKKLGSTKAVFVGHDHLNDFSFMKDEIMLAYGRVSGYYEYAMPGFPKGARIIMLKDNHFETSIQKM